ncbi:unnamed protein product [Parnassius apollo]|uniref:(apollo) hypothetical protein n=1 Tax=Parnassius apollo TaxID=110799 RepID=A0A8S3VZZ2_PARAO|nr:unnamed protein product [Parnassius apollo]
MKIGALLNEKFNEFKTLLFGKICNLTYKIDKLEERILKMDKNNNVSTQGYAVAVQHPSNLDNRKTKPKVKSGPQEKNKGASGKPNPPAKLHTPISSLSPVSTLISDSNTSILSVSHETTVAPRDGVEQKDSEEWIQSPDSKTEQVHNVRPRRNRKLPDRFVENQILTNLHGNEDEKPDSITENNANDERNRNSQNKKAVVILTPLKPHNKIIETSLADCRPKRICRLPSKFEDYSVSPNKHIPVHPIQASTPIVQNESSKISSKIKITKDNVEVSRKQKLQSRIKNRLNIKEDNLEEKTSLNSNVSIEKSKTNQVPSTKPLPIKKATQKTLKGTKKDMVSSKKQSDTNNNANDLTKDKGLCIASLPCMNVNKNNGYRFLEKNYSFKVFDDRKAMKRDASTLDVYEFTYDPTEEPAPQKKKRKRVVQKRKEKPKTILTNNYDRNVAKSLAALKNILLTKSSQTKQHTEKTVTETKTIQKNITSNQNLNQNKETKTATKQVNNAVQEALQKHYNSFQVEDIVLESEPVANGHSDINYSPVNSPNHVSISNEPKQGNNNAVEVNTTNKDPLNLQDDHSFFDECPAASSSMNVSTRNPLATPWRVEFERLPIKWQVNTYVKPNMTPAIESSFINFNDNKRKHVYTNMVPEENCTLPEIIESNNATNLKQTNIISFFKEVVDKNTSKKFKNKATPIKTNSIFEDITNTSETAVTPVKQIASNKKSKSVTPIKKKSSDNVTSSTDNTSVSDKENSIETIQNDKQKPQSSIKDNDVTFFGFDESDEQNQENVSPNKEKCPIRALRPRSRAVLRELNVQTVPKRAVYKQTEKNKNNDNARNNKIFDEMKASNPPISQENAENICDNSKDINDPIIAHSANLSGEDSQSVHLFEDLELLDVIHHVKPSRKSYARNKKVTFRQNSVSSDTQESDLVEQNKSSEEEDNLLDLTFQEPAMEPKKPKRKKKPNKQFSKKEAKEAEAWAAGFNSMCEEVDEFDLVIE